MGALLIFVTLVPAGFSPFESKQEETLMRKLRQHDEIRVRVIKRGPNRFKLKDYRTVSPEPASHDSSSSQKLHNRATSHEFMNCDFCRAAQHLIECRGSDVQLISLILVLVSGVGQRTPGQCVVLAARTANKPYFYREYQNTFLAFSPVFGVF